MKIKEPLTLGSNIFYLIPLVAAYSLDLDVFVISISLVFLSSVFFHGSKPKGPIWWNHTERLELYQVIALWVDTFFATLLGILNFVYLVREGPGPIFWSAMMLSVVAFLLLFLKKNKKKYSSRHSTWHFFSSIITLLAILA